MGVGWRVCYPSRFAIGCWGRGGRTRGNLPSINSPGKGSADGVFCSVECFSGLWTSVTQRRAKWLSLFAGRPTGGGGGGRQQAVPNSHRRLLLPSFTPMYKGRMSPKGLIPLYATGCKSDQSSQSTSRLGQRSQAQPGDLMATGDTGKRCPCFVS